MYNFRSGLIFDDVVDVGLMHMMMKREKVKTMKYKNKIEILKSSDKFSATLYSEHMNFVFINCIMYIADNFLWILIQVVAILAIIIKFGCG